MLTHSLTVGSYIRISHYLVSLKSLCALGGVGKGKRRLRRHPVGLYRQSESFSLGLGDTRSWVNSCKNCVLHNNYFPVQDFLYFKSFVFYIMYCIYPTCDKQKRIGYSDNSYNPNAHAFICARTRTKTLLIRYKKIIGFKNTINTQAIRLRSDLSQNNAFTILYLSESRQNFRRQLSYGSKRKI